MSIKEEAIRRPDSLTDIVAEKIRSAIIESKFDLGQPISENMLSEIYDISKTPIKLALAQLRQQGLVEVYPQKGSFVFLAAPEDLLMLVEWRSANEVAALQSGFARHKRVLIETMRADYDKMQIALEHQNVRKSFALDAEFHRNIVANSGNKYFLSAYDANIHKMNALLVRCGCPPWEDKNRFEEHMEIILALENDNLQLAQALLSVHIGHLCEKAQLLS